MTTLGVIVAVLSLLGGLWAFEGHYATNKRVNGEIERVEIEVAGAIQSIQIKNDYKFYVFMYDKLTSDITSLRRRMRGNPSDIELKREYDEVVRERKEVKKKMDELLRKIN
jgi:hypothetical protein